MADVSSIKPYGAGGASYNLKDATARSNISGLNTRVTALENAGSGASTYFSDDYGNDPEGDYGFTDCGYTVIVDTTRWIYDDNNHKIQRTYHNTWSYYNNLTDSMERVGTPKVGDLIFVNYNGRLSITGTMPTNAIIGKFNTTSLDSHYTQLTPPTPSEDINVMGSGDYVNLGNSYYSTYKAFYIVGLATVNVPSEEIEGKMDTLLIAKCFGAEG